MLKEEFLANPAVPSQADGAERLARKFHETYERLAPSFGYTTRKESAVPWEKLTDTMRRLMMAVAGEVFQTELSPLREAIVGLLNSADASWYERGSGHDWREAVHTARAALDRMGK